MAKKSLKKSAIWYKPVQEDMSDLVELAFTIYLMPFRHENQSLEGVADEQMKPTSLKNCLAPSQCGVKE